MKLYDTRNNPVLNLSVRELTACIDILILIGFCTILSMYLFLIPFLVSQTTSIWCLWKGFWRLFNTYSRVFVLSRLVKYLIDLSRCQCNELPKIPIKTGLIACAVAGLLPWIVRLRMSWTGSCLEHYTWRMTSK